MNPLRQDRQRGTESKIFVSLSFCRVYSFHWSRGERRKPKSSYFYFWGNRKIAIIRELTKLYEEIFRGKIDKAIEKFSSTQIKGEFVLILEGNTEEDEEIHIDIKKELNKYIKEGLSKKESVKIVAEKYNLPRNQVYKESIGR